MHALLTVPATWLALSASFIPAHDGPDPIGSWALTQAQLREGRLDSLLGADGEVVGRTQFVPDPLGESLYFDGASTRILLERDEQRLPVRHMTVEAWISVNAPQAWGGLLGVLQDNGDAERGWIVGYDSSVFTFGLASVGADDGNGAMTYLKGKTKWSRGAFHHVVATYDGDEMRLYVDGELDASTDVQSGDILYPERAPLVLGGYVDDNESYFHEGRIRSVKLFDRAASGAWAGHAFAHLKDLGREEPYVWVDPELRFVVRPYLQWATSSGMTIRWETSRPATTVVEWGTAVQWVSDGETRLPTLPQVTRAPGGSAVMLHELRLEGLEEDRAYYYRAISKDDLGRELRSPVLSFQTACGEDTPFAFAVISDTQGNPEVNERIAGHAFAHRPRFVIHPGDLVDTGSVKPQWVNEFFGSMRPLFERVAFFPVLGNHEQDARLYYDYMSLPDPEYRYTFRYGNAQFFMLDSNREVGPGTQQYAWLDGELAESEATWKIVVYHHPAYSSDENDYGDTWTGPSTQGDERVRELVPLYDRHGVDIVWNGHIHSYERTWPLRAGKATRSGEGTTYMITGGGGGSLETPGPIRPFFQNHVRRGHHYCMVAINGETLELKAFDLEDRLFDVLTIEKRD